MEMLEALQWKMRAKRSKRYPPPPPNDDELAAAESLLLLAISGGGFCSTTASTISPPKKHQELSPSAVVETAGDTIPAASTAKKHEKLSPDTPLQNSCCECGEVFQSFQALGGHMTSHRVKIRNAAVAEDRGHRNSAAESSGRFHECSFCHVRFATGQALGGHKRKHYEGPTLVRKAAKYSNSTFSDRTAAGDSGEESSGGRPLLDLNLPPPPEIID